MDFLRTGQLVNVPDFAEYKLLSPRVVKRYTGVGVSAMLGAALVKEGRLVSQLVMLETTLRQCSKLHGPAARLLVLS